MVELQPPAPDYAEPVGRRMPLVELFKVELPVSDDAADMQSIPDKDETEQ